MNKGSNAKFENASFVTALKFSGRSVSDIAIIFRGVKEIHFMIIVELKVFLDSRKRIHLISGKAEFSCCC